MALAGALGLRLDPLIAVNFYIMLIDTSSALALATSLVTSAIGDIALGGFSSRAGALSCSGSRGLNRGTRCTRGARCTRDAHYAGARGIFGQCRRCTNKKP